MEPQRVLVVDDHPAVALALKLHFRRDGRFVVGASAATAADGLRLVDEGFDAILLDLHLPDQAGVPLVQAFRERAVGVPLILYSAADDTAEVQAVRGMVDAVARKGEIADVIAALERTVA